MPSCLDSKKKLLTPNAMRAHKDARKVRRCLNIRISTALVLLGGPAKQTSLIPRYAVVRARPHGSRVRDEDHKNRAWPHRIQKVDDSKSCWWMFWSNHGCDEPKPRTLELPPTGQPNISPRFSTGISATAPHGTMFWSALGSSGGGTCMKCPQVIRPLIINAEHVHNAGNRISSQCLQLSTILHVGFPQLSNTLSRETLVLSWPMNGRSQYPTGSPC